MTEGEKTAETASAVKEDIASEARVTLKLWDVPKELADKFIRIAKGRYANKSWLALQDLMLKADKYDEFLCDGTLADHETRISAMEEFVMKLITESEVASKEILKEDEEKKANQPKTFGVK